MENQPRAVVIYKSNGEAGAYMVYPYIFNLSGEWIGWITPEREVYSLLGVYVGYLSRDPRVLRKRNMETIPARRQVIKPPYKFNPPATAPLAPLMSELSFDVIDVLMERPDELHTLDSGDLRDDMD